MLHTYLMKRRSLELRMLVHLTILSIIFFSVFNFYLKNLFFFFLLTVQQYDIYKI